MNTYKPDTWLVVPLVDGWANFIRLVRCKWLEPSRYSDKKCMTWDDATAPKQCNMTRIL